MSGAAVIWRHPARRDLCTTAQAVFPNARLRDSASIFRMRFWVNDARPRPWDGSLTVSGGAALRIRNWRHGRGIASTETAHGRSKTRQVATSTATLEEERPAESCPMSSEPALSWTEEPLRHSFRARRDRAHCRNSADCLEAARSFRVGRQTSSSIRVTTAEMISAAGIRDDFAPC